MESWNPNAYDQLFESVSTARLLEAAEVVADTARQKLKSQIGKGFKTGINRPIYRRGIYKGQPWTKREFGSLLKSIRVTQKLSKSGHVLWKRKNVRVYAGNYYAYYAQIFEFSNPFMRPALAQSMVRVNTIIGVK